MRRKNTIAGALVACTVFAGMAVSAFAQGVGGAPGMPMQRMGPAPGQATGMGTPGMPMQRMGRSGGIPQATAPTRRNYSGIAGVPGKMSSQNFRASTMASQFKSGGMQRSSSGIISGASRGLSSVRPNPR